MLSLSLCITYSHRRTLLYEALENSGVKYFTHLKKITFISNDSPSHVIYSPHPFLTSTSAQLFEVETSIMTWSSLSSPGSCTRQLPRIQRTSAARFSTCRAEIRFLTFSSSRCARRKSCATAREANALYSTPAKSLGG